MEQIEAAVNATAMVGEANPGAGVVADAAEREGMILAEAEAEAEAQAELAASMARLEKVVTIVVPIFFSLVVLVGFFGNLLVVLVVTFNRQMRNTTNMLILNLAVADILFIVFCVPFTATIYALPHDWPFGDAWCKIVQLLIIATAFVSIYTLVFMSLDRFLAVVYPIESMTWRTEANCRVTILVTWLATFVVCFPIAFANGQVETKTPMPPPSPTPPFNTSDPQSMAAVLAMEEQQEQEEMLVAVRTEEEQFYVVHKYCTFLNNASIPFLPGDARWSLLAFQLSFFVTAYVLPLLLIIGLYSVMLHRLWNTAPGGRASAESIKNKKRVIKMVLIVVVIFALSWLPIHVALVLRALGMYPITPISITFQVTAQILAYSNSCVNPILYAFLSEPFRRGFYAVITCIRPSGPHGVQQNGFEMADAATAAVAANKLKSKAAAGGGGGGRAAVAKTTLAGATTRVVERQQMEKNGGGEGTKTGASTATVLTPASIAASHSDHLNADSSTNLVTAVDYNGGNNGSSSNGSNGNSSNVPQPPPSQNGESGILLLREERLEGPSQL